MQVSVEFTCAIVVFLVLCVLFFPSLLSSVPVATILFFLVIFHLFFSMHRFAKRVNHFDVYCRLADQLSPCNSSDEGDSEIDSINDDLSSNVSNNSGSKRQKRGILPKQATSVMRAWLFQHLVVSSYSAILIVSTEISLLALPLHSCNGDFRQLCNSVHIQCVCLFIWFRFVRLCCMRFLATEAPLSNGGRETSHCRSNEFDIVAGLTLGSFTSPFPLCIKTKPFIFLSLSLAVVVQLCRLTIGS